jgi:hypothetical protein
MTAPITACPCGSTRFTVSESYVYVGTLEPDGSLHYNSWPASGGRDVITCDTCFRDYADTDFKAVIID